MDPDDQLPEHLFAGGKSKVDSKLSKKHGLLSAVIENSSQTSSLANSKAGGDNGTVRSTGSSLATKSVSSFRT
jgi:hypothetical protein